jgi:hypothetical protein
MRWISTVALQANLQGKDGTGEGENDSEGAHTPTRGRARLRVEGRACLGVGGCTRLGEVRTPSSGGRARLRGGAHDWWGGAHACEWGGCAHLGRGVRTPRKGGACLGEGRAYLGVGGRARLRGGGRARCRVVNRYTK